VVPKIQGEVMKKMSQRENPTPCCNVNCPHILKSKCDRFQVSMKGAKIYQPRKGVTGYFCKEFSGYSDSGDENK